MLLFGASNRIITRFEIQGEEAVGWDVDGKEVARVPFTEPTWTRPHYDEKPSFHTDATIGDFLSRNGNGA